MAKLKRIKLGRKPEAPTAIPEKKIYYPEICIRNKKLPIESENVGKIFNASVQLKLVGVRQETNESRGSKNNYDFEVREIVFKGDL